MREAWITAIVIVVAFVGGVLVAKASTSSLPKDDPKIRIIRLMGADGVPCTMEVAYPFGLESIGKVQHTTCPYRDYKAK